MTTEGLKKIIDQIKDEHDGETFDLMLPLKKAKRF